MNQQADRGLYKDPEKHSRKKEVISASAADEFRKASERFYAALNRILNGNTAPLADGPKISLTEFAVLIPFDL